MKRIKKRYECSECNKASNDPQEINNHIREKHSDVPMAISINMINSEKE